MARSALIALLALAGLLRGSDAASSRTSMKASVMFRGNPMRKVVMMLQDMQKSVEEEGEKGKELFDKFMCYCQTGTSQVTASIESNTAKAQELTNQIQEKEAEKSQIDQEISEHKADRDEAETAMKENSAMREKEAAEFAEMSGETKSNIQALTGALEALKKGLTTELLQTGTGSLLRGIIERSPDVSDEERQALLGFLQSGGQDTSGELEGSGGTDQIVGIVEQMMETMGSDLQESTDKEAEQVTTFNALMAAKSKESSTASKAIEEKMLRTGQAAVESVQAKGDLTATETSLAESKDLIAGLTKECASKQKEQEEREKINVDEIQAISETIKILNDDDALELFKKTMPSFLQTSASTRSKLRSKARTRARAGGRWGFDSAFLDLAHGAALRQRTGGRHRVVAHARHRALARSGGFEKVIAMTDGMVDVLESQQEDETGKDHWCIAEIDKSADEIKALGNTVADLEASIEEKTDSVASVSSEIEELRKDITDLDKQVAEATEQRKSEHAEWVSTAAANSAAVDLLGMAKNRLNKFYNPKIPQPAALPQEDPAAFVQEQPKEDEREDQLSSALFPFSFAQVSMRAGARASSKARAMTIRSFSAYQKSQAAGGILQMLDQMVKDVQLDIAEARHDEEEGQKDYEEAMKEAAEKRSGDSKLVVSKEGEKAGKTAELADVKGDHSAKVSMLKVMKEKESDLHKTCDVLLKEYEARRQARLAEEESLKNSKAVLMGAKLTLLQQQRAHH